jgi:nucleoside-triphosphatase
LTPPVRLLLEGRPGTGKTTVVRRLADLLSEAGVPATGFVTEEVRERGRRVGFRIEALSGRRGMLAHVDLRGPPRVGKYGVDLSTFEQVALPALAKAEESGLVVIDELGKMELASDAFRTAVAGLFDRPVSVVATVLASRHPFTDALKRRSDVETIVVTTQNRDSLPRKLFERIERRFGPA